MKSLKITIKFIIYFFITLWVKAICKKAKSQNGVLLIKTDGIGDYILFRNLIPFYKQHFKGKKITYLCTNVVKDFTSTIDKDLCDEFQYINLKKYETNWMYVFHFLKAIRESGFETIVQPTYSRTHTIDWICFVSGARQKVAFDGSLHNTNRVLQFVTTFFYTQIINSNQSVLFEFGRNKEFVKKYMNIDIQISQTSLNLGLGNKKNSIVIFPGSSQVKTQWNIENFALLAKKLIDKGKYQILICGSSHEYELGNSIKTVFPNENITNLCGKTTLIELAHILNDAKILISNDTGAIHIAAAINTPFICISNGKHFGRYSPYPTEMNVNGVFAYPDVKFYQKEWFEKLSHQYKYESDFNINDIKVERVWEKVEWLIKDP